MRRASRGFTLVELTVALVAGLIVAMGIVGLSKEATRTFHEEMRTAAAEATLRTAIDRLRADLERAGYMSTGNIMLDPRIARAPGAANNVANVGNAMVGIRRLAAIRLYSGGSSANTPLSAQQKPPITPDAIEIAGNMTSAEQFEVETIQVSGNCTRLSLSSTSPAMYRINAVGAKTQAVELNAIFQPYPGKQFMVRLVDDTGRAQFLATCPGTTTAGFQNTTQPYVDVDSTNTPVLSAQATRTMGGVSGTPSGRAFVNPVQIVRWELTNASLEPAQYQNALATLSLTSAIDANKYDLVRSFVDATGTVVAETSEIVAEYAVDLDFAFSVENGTAAQPSMLTFSFDDPTNQTWGDDVSLSKQPPPMPERIRIVRARLVTRAAQPDRTVNLPVTNFGGQTFLFRYCLNGQGCAATDRSLQWARVRTITAEVSVPNGAGSFY
jgi:prepilin-type N-terminal cleavage/methylation domain-containing protein